MIFVIKLYGIVTIKLHTLLAWALNRGELFFSSPPYPTDSGVHPAWYVMGTGVSFLESKGAEVDRSSHLLNTTYRTCVELYLLSSMCFNGVVINNTDNFTKVLRRTKLLNFPLNFNCHLVCFLFVCCVCVHVCAFVFSMFVKERRLSNGEPHSILFGDVNLITCYEVAESDRGERDEGVVKALNEGPAFEVHEDASGQEDKNDETRYQVQNDISNHTGSRLRRLCLVAQVDADQLQCFVSDW